jgi:hypothetical protein
VAQLPVFIAQPFDEFPYPLEIALVGEVCPQRAAAVLGTTTVDPLAAAAENASPPGREPRQVATKQLTVVRGIGELDPGAREVKIHFGHLPTVLAASSPGLGSLTRVLAPTMYPKG